MPTPPVITDAMRQRLAVPVKPCAAPVVPSEGGDLPEWIHLAAFGEFQGHYMGGFVLGEPEIDQCIRNFGRNGIDVVIDLDHLCLSQDWHGQPVPAQGWIDALERREDGLWGHIRYWTAEGAERLKARTYRYISPTFVFGHREAQTGADVGTWLHSVALTNNPFLAGLLTPPLPNRHNSPPERMMPLLTLLALAMSLPSSADEQQVRTRAEALNANHKALATRLGLPESTPPEQLALELDKLETRLALGQAVEAKLFAEGMLPKAEAVAKLHQELEHAGYVPMGAHLEALRSSGDELAALQDDQVLERALSEGRVTPAGKEPFARWLKSDRASALSWLKVQPKASAVPVESPFAGGKPPSPSAGAADFDARAEEAAKACGVSKEDWLKARAYQREQGVAS